MRRRQLAAIVLALVIVASARAEEFTATPVAGGPPVENRITLALIAEGYSKEDHQKGEFKAAAKEHAEGLLSVAPYSDYKDLFQFVAIEVPSPGSGIPLKDSASPTPTYFDTSIPAPSDTGPNYGTPAFKRWHSAQSKIHDVNPGTNRLLNVVICKEPRKGGCALNDIVLMTAGADKTYCLCHEVGHALGKLADEYSNEAMIPSFPLPAPPEDLPAVNVTLESNQANVKWKNIRQIVKDDNETWHHSGGYYRTPEMNKVWRPRDKCRMNNNGDQFCEICRLQLVHAMFEHVNMVELAVPPPLQAVDLEEDGRRTFKVKLIPIAKGRTKGEWFVDGDLKKSTTAQPGDKRLVDEFTLNAADVGPGQKTLRYQVTHSTHTALEDALVKDTTAPAGKFHNQWTWSVNIRGAVKMLGDTIGK